MSIDFTLSDSQQELQKNAQRPIADLAQKAGLSASSCHRRVKLLEEAGVIVGYTANLDRAAIRARGVSPLHRMSFQSLAYQQLEL